MVPLAHHPSAVALSQGSSANWRPPGDHGIWVLYWLSGLTCTDETFIIKSGAQRTAVAHDLALVTPDTCPMPPKSKVVVVAAAAAVAAEPVSVEDLFMALRHHIEAGELPPASKVANQG
ncbi:hypothetical protein D1007_58117 [Hordeum vulgare]|nr:hypothetical protein D1007_58117 [Hordeum vulgare]